MGPACYSGTAPLVGAHWRGQAPGGPRRLAVGHGLSPTIQSPTLSEACQRFRQPTRRTAKATRRMRADQC